MANTKFCLGISDISDSYTGFVIDTWGVLHNNEHAFDSAIECLKELRARKKFVLLLSNTELRAEESAEHLKSLGISSNLYDAILTSGEVAWNGIRDQKDPGFENLGQDCYLIGGERTENFLTNLGVNIVKSPSDASFLVIAGWDQIDHANRANDEILRECVRKRLKALCINPDSRALFGTGYTTGTGQVVKRFQEFGGVVHFIGKPYKPIFHQCIKILHKNDIYPGQTVMIGDTMAHDILGATLMNMDTCLVKNGMHGGMFKNAATPADVNKQLGILISQFGQIKPTYLVDKLKWGKALPDRKHKKRKVTA